MKFFWNVKMVGWKGDGSCFRGVTVGRSVGRFGFSLCGPLLSGELDVHSFVYSNTPLSPLSRGDSDLCVQIFRASPQQLVFALL